MRGWNKSASLLLVFCGPVLARVPCPAEQAGTIRVGAQRFAVEVAATPATRERGLSGHKRLMPNTGMWFVLPEVGMPGFWMHGMRFPIDLIWVSPEQWVVGAVALSVCRADPCPITYPSAPVAYVLEVGAGRFAGRVGDRVEWGCGKGSPPPAGAGAGR